MPLIPGTRLGPYEIVAAIGAGGMGEVYRATDTKLNRAVALKILPETFTTDADRLARFTREAQVLASLNHPNIGGIYGFEDSGAVHALVMELVEGEDLAQMIARGPIAVPDAVTLARQIADALEAAHERGIIHRDLKPANIKVRTDGAVKVLDFGLAKSTDTSPGSAPSLANSPTLTAQGTTAGMILGTAAYMSPEQARGKPADKRADIWSFGVILYEMLTGHRAFPGEEISDVLAAVLRQDLDWAALPDSTPRRLRRLLERCLDRDAKTRLRDIGEARVALAASDAADAPSPDSVAHAPRAPRPWLRDPRSIVTIALAGAGVSLAFFALTRPPAEVDLFPARIEIPATGSGTAALSPDGHSVVFAARSPTGTGTALYLRRLDQTTARAIPGTEDVQAGDASFSPDGRAIVFIANRRTVMKLPFDGAPVALGDIGDMGGGLDWSKGDEIIAGTGVAQGLKGLVRVNASGGPMREFTHVDAAHGDLSHQWPRVLQDGKTVLFTIWRGSIDQAELAAASLDDGKVVRLGIVAPRALGVVDGQLLYVQANGVAMAVPFDVTTRRASGTAVPVQDSIATGTNGIGGTKAFLTAAGGLIFSTGEAHRRLVWVDRSGRIAPAFKDARAFGFVRLSPDERQAAVEIATGNANDLWALDFAAGTLTRLTTTGQTRNPSWLPDGRQIVFASTHGGRGQFWKAPADASAAAVTAGEPPHNPWWADVSPDGRVVMFNAIYDGSWNLETLSLEDGHEVRAFAAAPVIAETMGRFSPDGTLVAYVSNESGREEIYVRPFAPGGARVQISTDGGRRPIWSRDGTKIFFWQGNQLTCASIVRQPSVRVTSRQALFAGDYSQDFDVAADGRFLMIEQDNSGESLVVIPNWRTELRRITGASRGR